MARLSTYRMLVPRCVCVYFACLYRCRDIMAIFGRLHSCTCISLMRMKRMAVSAAWVAGSSTYRHTWCWGCPSYPLGRFSPITLDYFWWQTMPPAFPRITKWQFPLLLTLSKSDEALSLFCFRFRVSCITLYVIVSVLKRQIDKIHTDRHRDFQLKTIQCTLIEFMLW